MLYILHSWAGGGERKQIANSPNQTVAAAQRDDTELSCCLIALLQTSEISQIWRLLWCSLLHKHQHVLDMIWVWLRGATGAERSRPGEAWQPKREAFCHLTDPIQESFTKKICVNLMDVSKSGSIFAKPKFVSHMLASISKGFNNETAQSNVGIKVGCLLLVFFFFYINRKVSLCFSTNLLLSHSVPLCPSHMGEVSLQLYARKPFLSWCHGWEGPGDCSSYLIKRPFFTLRFG